MRVVEYLLIAVEVLLALYDPKLPHLVVDLVPLFPPEGLSGLKVELVADHLALRVEGLVHAVQDVLVRLVADEGQRVDLVAVDAGGSADLLEDVFGEELAAGVEDVVLVLEDVGDRGTGSVVAQLALVSSLHGKYIMHRRTIRSAVIEFNIITDDQGQENLIC